MDSIATPLTDVESAARAGSSARASAYFELTKPRITLLVVLTAVAGFWLAQGPVHVLRLLSMALGVGLLASGKSTLNQYIERDLDGLMRRTRDRPLPSKGTQALLFGVALSAVAIAYLAIALNPLSALLGLATLATYLFVYTPFKTRTALSTVLGAFPGAMPPFIGWWQRAARRPSKPGFCLRSCFCRSSHTSWPSPGCYRDDYARAAIKMLPVVDPEGRVTGSANRDLHIVADLGEFDTGACESSGTSLPGWSVRSRRCVFVLQRSRAALVRTASQARRLLLASVLYLPFFLG